MKNTLFGLFVAALLCSGIARASDASASAQDRATLYQREVRAALGRHNWRITQDETGKLTAERHYIAHHGTDDFLIGSNNSYARLQIAFQADGKGHTATAAHASLCIYDPVSSSRVGFMAYPPLPLRDPELTQEYLQVLAEASTHLAGGHDVPATHTASNSQNADASSKVAVK